MPTRLFHRHDAYFKRLLDQPGTALALLRERLPTAIAGRLVDEEPESLPTSFISDELEERRPDRLYRTRTREGQPVLVYTLVEHKSSPDQRTGLQLLGYDAQILNWWDKLEGRDENGRLRKLPALFSIVVYNGEERWNVPLTLAGATEGGDDDEIRPWLPDCAILCSISARRIAGFCRGIGYCGSASRFSNTAPAMAISERS